MLARQLNRTPLESNRTQHRTLFMKDYSYITNADPSYIDSLYQQYLEHPERTDPDWSAFFKGFHYARLDEGSQLEQTPHTASYPLQKELQIAALIQAFRSKGHLIAHTNPIRKRKNRNPRLALEDFELEPADLDQKFYTCNAFLGHPASLRELIERLHTVYAGSIGYEYAYIESHEKKSWLQNHIESPEHWDSKSLPLDDKKRILEKLNGAVIFEKFLHTKYVGQKRFSLEGGESAIPALDFIIDAAANNGVEEVVIGMAHRGRLNVLANTIGKTYEQIFSEFEGTAVPDLSFGSGDVKYHLGFSSQVISRSGKKVQLKLAPNPSHLEAVNPVVLGLSRAKADLLYHSDYDKILPVLIHGDAAVAGQGIVYETVQMSQLKGFYTGGTIHFIINNQIGFTTDFDDARSSTYCTASAYMVQAPVFHVNGDDPEAVVRAVLLAVAYRQTFNEDVFIDMVCYRRHGHNEGDDPKFTQPTLYNVINKHPNVRELYNKVLTERGDVEAQLAQEMEKEFWDHLQERLQMAKEKPLPYSYQEPELSWKSLRKRSVPADFEKSPLTGIDSAHLADLLDKLLREPDGFHVLPKVKRLFKSWKELVATSKLDWALAELLAYASLLTEAKNVRISGQDVKRGTFSHRHAVLFDEQNNTEYNRLSNLGDGQGSFFIYNSLLSEFGVLGFEYGYSLASPDHLILWEAQFGDFANGAQVIIDQFISTAQSKWNRMSGLVMLLPHGYDGQGPEHSSARLERYLQSCAELNMVVVNASTPANFFHALRRQLHWDFRKPLIVMSPKSLLRHPDCISDFAGFQSGTRFMEVLDDELPISKNKIKKLLICSGQFYYDLQKRRIESERKDLALIRIEQLYPFPEKQIEALLQKYLPEEVLWCQEEPMNMGAATHVFLHWKWGPLRMFGRPTSAASAVGHKKIHDQQLSELLQNIFEA